MNSRTIALCNASFSRDRSRDFADTLDQLGLLPFIQDCVQLNTFKKDAEYRPIELVQRGGGEHEIRKIVRAAVQRNITDTWTIGEPRYAFVNHEPKREGGSWIGGTRREGLTPEDMIFFRIAHDEARMQLDQHGLGNTLLGLYGLPFAEPDRQWLRADMPYLRQMAGGLAPFDWWMNEVYPGNESQRQVETPAQIRKHFVRVNINLRMMRRFAPGKPAISAHWPRPGMPLDDLERFFQVQLAGASQSGADTILYWVNTDGNTEAAVKANARWYAEATTRLAPMLEAYVKGEVIALPTARGAA